MAVFKDISGLRFSRLIVIKISKFRSRDNRFLWECLCDCGNIIHTKTYLLNNGETKSCGCYSKQVLLNFSIKHGFAGRKTKTPEFTTWLAIRTRCRNPNLPNSHVYVGKGIKVCKRWENSFPLFLKDMGVRPSPKHSIDRINNNGDYKPSNCRWATSKEQGRNKSTNVMLTYNKKTMCISAWAETLGIKDGNFRWHLKSGKTIKDIILIKNINYE